jgi:hypothetical protein
MCDYSEFDAVLSRYFDGEASPQDVARLEEALAADEQFAEHVSRWCFMHRQICEVLNEDALHHLMDQFVTGAPGLPKGAISSFSLSTANSPASTRSEETPQAPSKSKRAIGNWLLTAFALAAMLVVGIGAATWWIRPGQSSRDETADAKLDAKSIASRPPGPADGQPPILATVTQLVAATWRPGAAELRHGQQLSAGTVVQLQSGMAKVTYECGAEVVLEGPCEFVIQDKLVGLLKSGKITADVPRRAFAFAVLAPSVDFVDLGTSFGLNVGGGGKTELHVFDGEVLCNQTAPAGNTSGELIHVTANNALGFKGDGARPDDIAIDRQQFSQLIALRKDVNVRPQHWISDQLALWLAADAGVSVDKQNRVMAWRDIVYADNRSAEDAIQADENAQPRLVDNALHGHPAIRFDGASDYLLTTPLQTTDDQTVLFVCQFSPSAFDKDRRWGGQIINYDGPPSRYLSDTLEPGVLQIGEPLLEQQFKPSLLTGQVFAGFIGSTTVEAGRIDSQPIGADAPVVVAYVYDYSHGQAEFQINGRSYGEARAFAPQAITSRKIIGRHAWMQNFFHGDLAELMIYNKALSAKELADATSYLADKYAISMDGKAPALSKAD